ncbi:hypothetical protein PHYC_03442 [Phycisphaerales bacterium]|nr:hypothetical protein PHYC_03442 [Phycisphaerales bacterium]
MNAAWPKSSSAVISPAATLALSSASVGPICAPPDAASQSEKRKSAAPP